MKEINIVGIIKNKDKLEKHEGYLPIPILHWIDIGKWGIFLEKHDKKLYEQWVDINWEERQAIRKDEYDYVQAVEKWIEKNPQFSNFIIESSKIKFTKEDNTIIEKYFRDMEK